MRTRTIALAIGTILATALGPVPAARAADPVTVTFSATGAEQAFDVPSGVTTIHVVLVGAWGGGAMDLVYTPGGRGARVAGDLGVTPGSRLWVEVGGVGVDVGSGSPSGTFNGGGGGLASGGGASDLRTVARAQAGSLASRLLVAGGGGGTSIAFQGGDAGQPAFGPFAGGAGSASSGGVGGGSAATGAVGQPGALGVGGAGAQSPCDSLIGAGGGGGYFGGGGGGVEAGCEGNGYGAGGGGSSYTGTATNTNVSVDTSGVPSVVISYVPADGAGTVVGVVTMALSAVCLELSTSSVDFGTRRFGEVGAAAAPSFEVTNCSGIAETVRARGTDAQGPGSSAWSLVDAGSCAAGTLGTDAYRLTLGFPAAPDVTIPLSTENSEDFVSYGPGDVVEHEVLIDTPCPGSSGAGEAMTMQILFVATEALP